MFVDHFSWPNGIFTVVLVVGMTKWALWWVHKDLCDTLEKWAKNYALVSREQLDEKFAAVDQRLDQAEEKITDAPKSG